MELVIDLKKEKKKLYNLKHREKDKERRSLESSKIRKRELEKIRYYKNWQKFQDKRKNIELKKNYNITLEEYNNLLKEQSYCCAICNKHESECKQKLHVDHDHLTGKIRGLLCGNCNPGLGLFKDNKHLLFKAYKYLNKI